jgi:hypothetical protein
MANCQNVAIVLGWVSLACVAAIIVLDAKGRKRAIPYGKAPMAQGRLARETWDIPKGDRP